MGYSFQSGRLTLLIAMALSAMHFGDRALHAQMEEELLLQPVVFQDPTTQPPATQPPATQPPTTQPPTTQPPATQPPATESDPPATGDSSTTPRSTLRSRRPSLSRSSNRGGTLGQYRSGYLADRLARAPNMFGDFFTSGGRSRFMVRPQGGPDQSIVFDMPTAGGSRRVKISENNKSLPTDRVFFAYNHFHKPLSVITPGSPPQGKSVDRYTLGLEKTFLDGMSSVELRMPFAGRYRFEGAGGVPQIESGRVGNLAVILKMLMIERESMAFAAGLGIDIPTGDDLTIDNMPGGIKLANESVHFLPWLGVSHTPTERTFWHSFIQLDLAANGNSLTLFDPFGAPAPLGMLNEQNLFYFDIGGGVWLYENESASHITGLAVTSEFHLATTLQNADIIDAPTIGTFGNTNNRQDFTNATIGLQLQLGPMKNLHIGGVFPLRSGVDQGFDSEVQVRLNCLY